MNTAAVAVGVVIGMWGGAFLRGFLEVWWPARKAERQRRREGHR